MFGAGYHHLSSNIFMSSSYRIDYWIVAEMVSISMEEDFQVYELFNLMNGQEGYMLTAPHLYSYSCRIVTSIIQHS